MKERFIPMNKIITSALTGAAALAISLSGAGAAGAVTGVATNAVHEASCAAQHGQSSGLHHSERKGKSHAKGKATHARHRAQGSAQDVVRHDPHLPRLARDGELARGLHRGHKGEGGQCGQHQGRGGTEQSGFRHDRHKIEGKGRHELHRAEGEGKHLTHRLERGRI
jgi:hypothetical protein